MILISRHWLLPLLLLSYTGWGQVAVRTTLIGKAIDKATGQPVAYTSVGLKNRLIGTVTNEEGEFDLRLPDLSANDTLVVTCVGYLRYETPVAPLLSDKAPLVIRLVAATYVLPEVLVKADERTAEDIVRQALSQISTNYPTRLYRMEGYFRKSMKVNGRFTYFCDAAVDIYDQGYTSGKEEQVYLKAVRLSADHNPKGFANVIDTHFLQLDNSIYHTLVQNFVRYQNEALRISKYTYELDSVLHMADRELYLITATLKHKSGMVWKRKLNTRMPAYQLFIDRETYAIYKIVYRPQALPINGPEDVEDVAIMDGNDRIESYLLGSQFQLVVEYRNAYQGRLYPSYIYTSAWVDDYDKAAKRIVYRNQVTEELMINRVETSMVALPTRAEPMNPEISLEQQAPRYDATFWQHYNIIKPLENQLNADMAQGVALKGQFRQRHGAALGRAERQERRYKYVRRR